MAPDDEGTTSRTPEQGDAKPGMLNKPKAVGGQLLKAAGGVDIAPIAVLGAATAGGVAGAVTGGGAGAAIGFVILGPAGAGAGFLIGFVAGALGGAGGTGYAAKKINRKLKE